MCIFRSLISAIACAPFVAFAAEPSLILGGEVRNSSASTREFMAPIWPRLVALNLNTVFLPIAWREVEPEEGRYDFALLDRLIDDARGHGLRIGLLWFGAWKNGVSGYAPAWVMANPARFTRMSATALSPFGPATLGAETRTFRQLFAHLREFDGARRTVIAVQVENEIGVGNPTRDRSPAAEKAFASAVPPRLLDEFARHVSSLKPYVRELWGGRRAGTWREVFGDRPETDDIFMAWSYGAYVQALAAAAKQEYPLRLFVNACQLRDDRYRAGADPSGGPVANVLDVWMAAAPAIDVFAVDAYRAFKEDAAAFRHRGNPLFIPESSSWYNDDPYASPAKAYYAVAEHDAHAFSVFGIDNEMYRDHLLGVAYRKLAELAPLIVAARGTGRMHGFYHGDSQQAGESFAFDGYRAQVTYRKTPIEGDRYGSFGLIIQSGADEFVVSARGATIRFESADRTRPVVANLGVEEGDYVDGEWKVRRRLSGDEVGGQGAEPVLTPPPFSRQAVIGEEPLTINRIRLVRLATWEQR